MRLLQHSLSLGMKVTDTISSDALATVSDANDGLPVVHNLFDWLQTAFVKTD